MTIETTERWRPVVGYPGYDVSDLGRVRSWRVRGRALNPHRRRQTPLIRKLCPNSRNGFLYVMLWTDGKPRLRQVHIMVLEAFVGFRGPGEDTRHRDGDVTNNRLDNLVWGIRKQPRVTASRAPLSGSP